MSRLDYCKYDLVDDCYDWKNDNCDECNIFKAYCEGARRAKNSIVRCEDCRHRNTWDNPRLDPQYYRCGKGVKFRDYGYVREDDYCPLGERREP